MKAVPDQGISHLLDVVDLLLVQIIVNPEANPVPGSAQESLKKQLNQGRNTILDIVEARVLKGIMIPIVDLIRKVEPAPPKKHTTKYPSQENL